MKKALGVLGFILFALFAGSFAPALAWSSDASPCENFHTIPAYSQLGIARAFDDISRSNNLGQYLSPDGTQYWLCFSSPQGWGTVNIFRSLTLSNDTDRPVVISGLKIGSQSIQEPLLSLSGVQSVILQNFTIQCKEGGTGIKLFGNGHHILKADIQNCAVGVQVGDDTHAGFNIHVGPDIAEDAARQKVTFSGDGIAFKVVNGTKNYFRHNTVYDFRSGWINSLDFKYISLEANTNDNLESPIILPKTGLEVFQRDVLEYPPEITAWPRDSSEMMATLKLKSPYDRGDLEIITYKNRIYDFYRDAHFVSSNPDGNGNYILTYQLPMVLDLLCREAVAIFHHPTVGSSPNSRLFYLNPPYSGKIDFLTICRTPTGIFSAPSQDDPGVQPQTSAPPLPLEEKRDEKQKEEMGISNPAGEISTENITQSGMADVSVVRSIGMGCSLNSNGEADPMNGSFIMIFVLSLAGFLSRRQRFLVGPFQSFLKGFHHGYR